MFKHILPPIENFPLFAYQKELDARCERIDDIVKKLPEYVDRKTLSAAIDGAYSVKDLVNVDRCGKGPKGAFKRGRVIVYPRESVRNWLYPRMT